MGWLGEEFDPPVLTELPTGEHLRPLRASDTAIDYRAVMASRGRLWARYGAAWSWPRASLTEEEDRSDLVRHEYEMAEGSAYFYALLDRAESELLGCVYIDPPYGPAPAGAQATVSWWLIDAAVGTALEREVDRFLPRWLARAWGISRIHVYP